MRYSQNRFGGYRGRRTIHSVLKTIAIVLAVLVVLVLAALVLGQDYIVFTDRGLRLDLPLVGEDSPAPERGDISVVVRPQESSAQAAQEEGGEPVDPAAASMRAAELPVSAVTDGTAAEQLEALGANALVLEMKDASGRLAWQSQQPLAVQNRIPMGKEEVNEALLRWNLGEVYTVARVCCFRDDTLPYQRNNVALRASYGNWRDALGLRWLDPDNLEVQDYLAGLCVELAQMGFDEIVLECCAFPWDGNLEAIVSKGSFVSQGYETAMSGFLARVRQELEPWDTLLSLRVEPDALGEGAARSGLTGALLERECDRLWMVEPDAQALTQSGVTRAQQRLVTIVETLDPEYQGAQAQG